MDRTDDTDFYQKALLRLLTTLFVLVGIVPGGEPVLRLSRLVRNQIMRLLLPIESAVRRLVYYKAQRLASAVSRVRAKASGRDKKKRKQRDGPIGPKAERAPVFRLFDRLKYFWELSIHKPKYVRGSGPRISFFDDRDAPRDPVAEEKPRDPDSALKLCRRMQAVMGALLDLDAQALRLRRLIDRRKAAGAVWAKTCPRRPGWPPGYRRNGTHEIHEILMDCDLMAREVPPPKPGGS